LFSVKSLRLSKIVFKKEVDIKLPATSIIKFETDLNFEDVEDLRGRQAILCLTDLKGSKIKKKFKFMPSYNRREVNRIIQQLENNL
jgi:hypothetical protein